MGFEELESKYALKRESDFNRFTIIDFFKVIMIYNDCLKSKEITVCRIIVLFIGINLHL